MRKKNVNSKAHEYRKESSRNAARMRRCIEAQIFKEMMAMLPFHKSSNLNEQPGRLNSSLQIDKISVVRISIAYIKLRQLMLYHSKDFPNIPKIYPSSNDLPISHPCDLLNQDFLKVLDCFFMIISENGTLIYLSDNVQQYLGISKICLLGQKISDFVHPCDQKDISSLPTLPPLLPDHKPSKTHGSTPVDIVVRLKCLCSLSASNANLSNEEEGKDIISKGKSDEEDINKNYIDISSNKIIASDRDNGTKINFDSAHGGHKKNGGTNDRAIVNDFDLKPSLESLSIKTANVFTTDENDKDNDNGWEVNHVVHHQPRLNRNILNQQHNYKVMHLFGHTFYKSFSNKTNVPSVTSLCSLIIAAPVCGSLFESAIKSRALLFSRKFCGPNITKTLPNGKMNEYMKQEAGLPNLIKEPIPPVPPFLVSKHKLDMKIMYFDERVTDILGYEIWQLVGRSYYDYIHVLDLETFRKSLQNLHKKGQVQTCFYRLLVNKGGYAWINTQASLVSSSNMTFNINSSKKSFNHFSILESSDKDKKQYNGRAKESQILISERKPCNSLTTVTTNINTNPDFRFKDKENASFIDGENHVYNHSQYLKNERDRESRLKIESDEDERHIVCFHEVVSNAEGRQHILADLQGSEIHSWRAISRNTEFFLNPLQFRTSHSIPPPPSSSLSFTGSFGGQLKEPIESEKRFKEREDMFKRAPRLIQIGDSQPFFLQSGNGVGKKRFYEAKIVAKKGRKWKKGEEDVKIIDDHLENGKLDDHYDGLEDYLENIKNNRPGKNSDKIPVKIHDFDKTIDGKKSKLDNCFVNCHMDEAYPFDFDLFLGESKQTIDDDANEDSLLSRAPLAGDTCISLPTSLPLSPLLKIYGGDSNVKKSIHLDCSSFIKTKLEARRLAPLDNINPAQTLSKHLISQNPNYSFSSSTLSQRISIPHKAKHFFPRLSADCRIDSMENILEDIISLQEESQFQTSNSHLLGRTDCKSKRVENIKRSLLSSSDFGDDQKLSIIAPYNSKLIQIPLSRNLPIIIPPLSISQLPITSSNNILNSSGLSDITTERPSLASQKALRTLTHSNNNNINNGLITSAPKLSITTTFTPNNINCNHSSPDPSIAIKNLFKKMDYNVTSQNLERNNDLISFRPKSIINDKISVAPKKYGYNGIKLNESGNFGNFTTNSIRSRLNDTFANTSVDRQFQNGAIRKKIDPKFVPKVLINSVLANLLRNGEDLSNGYKCFESANGRRDLVQSDIPNIDIDPYISDCKYRGYSFDKFAHRSDDLEIFDTKFTNLNKYNSLCRSPDDKKLFNDDPTFIHYNGSNGASTPTCIESDTDHLLPFDSPPRFLSQNFFDEGRYSMNEGLNLIEGPKEFLFHYNNDENMDMFEETSILDDLI
ncbi:uncharacterized protein LOC135923690 isoform X1 [Gordionus sp. m RMFG-2023]|uniref:uncharacterized protein LOC135923690 isoform X1 n=1 Tax=Gordionus sp. m RMFG-2023 TaxID=3053472 RepID=UPI0031FBCB91